MYAKSEFAGATAPDTVNGDASHELWARYFDGRDVDDRNRLVLFYAPLVRLVASRVARRMRSFQSVDELCSCGQFGLIDAVERFDPVEGYQFATYASIRIQGAIIDELRRDDILPKRKRAQVRGYRDAREALEASLRRTPTFGEVADYLGTSVADVVEIDDLASMSTYLVPLSLLGEEDAARRDGPGADGDALDLAAMRDVVKGALLRLTERQRQVLVLHYLEGFANSEIADTLGIDRSRVTQLMHQGLKNLRTELGDQGDLGFTLGPLDAQPSSEPHVAR